MITLITHKTDLRYSGDNIGIDHEYFTVNYENFPPMHLLKKTSPCAPMVLLGEYDEGKKTYIIRSWQRHNMDTGEALGIGVTKTGNFLRSMTIGDNLKIIEVYKFKGKIECYMIK